MWTGRLSNTIRTICKQNVLAGNVAWPRTLSIATVNYGDISKNSSTQNSNFANAQRRRRDSRARVPSTNDRTPWKQPDGSFEKPRHSFKRFSNDDKRPVIAEPRINRGDSKGLTKKKHREEPKDAKVDEPIHSMAEILKNRNDSMASVKKTGTVDAFSDDLLRIYDKELNLSYVKLPYDHPQLNSFMLMTKSKSHRSRKHQLMVEGRRLLIDTLEAGLPLEYVLFSRIEQLKLIKDNLVEAGASPKILRVPHHDLSFWSVLTTCPGIIGIFNKPEDMTEIYNRLAKTPEAGRIDEEGPKITVILDQIREPNNLGSVIRTCAAIPCQEVTVKVTNVEFSFESEAQNLKFTPFSHRLS